MSSRENACSRKRTQTLLKKTTELATLCGTDALLIIVENDPTDPGSHPIRSHTWPEIPDEVNRILKRYQDYCGSNRRDPKRRKIEEAGDRTVGDVSADDASLLLGLVDSKLSMVKSRLRELEEDRIRCCGASPEETYVPVAVDDVCSDQNMFVCGADSWDQAGYAPDFDWGSSGNFIMEFGNWDEECALMEFGSDLRSL